jgi:hypothetical protein
LTLTAAAVLIVCWYSAGGDYTFESQKTALNLAIVTVVVANLAGASLLVAGRRAVGIRRSRLLADAPSALARMRVGHGCAQGGSRVSAALVGGAGLIRYHRADCHLATGRAWPDAPRQSHEQDGRRPCGVCRP